MRFTMHLMRGTSMEATATVIEMDGETPQQLAERARDMIVSNAMDVREAYSGRTMSTAMLEEFVDIFTETVVAQATSRKRRYVTLHTRGETVFRREGMMTLLVDEGDISGMIDIDDDATLERESFRETAARTLGRAPRASDIVLEEMTDEDMERSFLDR